MSPCFVPPAVGTDYRQPQDPLSGVASSAAKRGSANLHKKNLMDFFSKALLVAGLLMLWILLIYKPSKTFNTPLWRLFALLTWDHKLPVLPDLMNNMFHCAGFFWAKWIFFCIFLKCREKRKFFKRFNVKKMYDNLIDCLGLRCSNCRLQIFFTDAMY